MKERSGIGPIDLLHPGEQADIFFVHDIKTGGQIQSWTITNAPGFKAWLLRLRYRIFRSHGEADIEIIVMTEDEPEVQYR